MRTLPKKEVVPTYEDAALASEALKSLIFLFSS